MKKLIVVAMGLMCAGWTWYEGDALDVKGRGWKNEGFKRLPEAANGKVSAPVWNMCHHSTGMFCTFTTDSDCIKVIWKLNEGAENARDPLIPPQGLTGIDIFQRQGTNAWKFIGNKRYEKRKDRPMGETEEIGIPKGAETMIYLPIRACVKEFKIGVQDGKTLQATEFGKGKKPIVHYGTSIVHGGCVSRAGLMFTSQVSRALENDYINLGFSGNGIMELPMADFLAQIDASIYVVDCAWNMGVNMVNTNAVPFLRKLHALKPATPILLCDGCRQSRNKWSVNEAMRKAYETLKAEAGWENLFYFYSEDMLPERDDVTHDFCHPNDFGAMFMSAAYTKRIKEVLDL